MPHLLFLFVYHSGTIPCCSTHRLHINGFEALDDLARRMNVRAELCKALEVMGTTAGGMV